MSESSNWNEKVLKQIKFMAETGKMPIEGMGSKKSYLNFDGLTFVPGQLFRQPLLDTEKLNLSVVLGPKAKKPVKVSTPVLIGPMSFGALSREAKIALAKASSIVDSLHSTGEGGMLEEERIAAKHLALQYSTGRFGITEETLKKADIIEIKIGQAAKPGMGGHLLKEKLSKEIAKVRGVEMGKDLISPPRHLDINSKQDLKERVEYLKGISNGVPIAIKLAGGNVEKDLEIALFAEPDILVIDGFGGSTGAAPLIAKDNVGMPLINFLNRTTNFLEKNEVKEDISLIATGGLRTGADFAKTLALGADAVFTCTSLLVSMGCIQCMQCHTGKCPIGLATQEEALRKKFNIENASLKAANFLNASTKEIETICRIVGKNDVNKLSKEDLMALDKRTSKITGVKEA